MTPDDHRPDERSADTEPVPEEVSDLLERRETYIEWLEKLDDLQEDTRPEVYRPVAADYRERLAEVESRLAEHRSALEGALGEREAELDELRAELEEHRRARDEAELRHRVGEYDEERWESDREEHERRIQELEGRLEVEEEAVGRLRDVVAAVAEAAGGPDGGGEPAEARAGEPLDSPSAEGESESGLEDVPSPPGDEPSPTPGGGPEEEAPGGGGPVGERAPDDASADEEGPAAEPDGETEGEEGYRDELEFLESLSLEEPEQFDAVSAMLDEEEEEGGSEDEKPGGAGDGDEAEGGEERP